MSIYQQKNNNIEEGFTLVELLVVISIIAVIMGLSVSNFLGARARARDAKSKAEMKEIKNALRLYYNDYTTYPGTSATAPYIMGCGANHISQCPTTSCSSDFSGGGADGCTQSTGTVVYMKRLPRDGSGAYNFRYAQSASGDDFCLTVNLENRADSEIAISQTRCQASCNATGLCTAGSSEYCMCAD